MRRKDNKPQRERPDSRQDARSGQQQPAQAHGRDSGRDEAFPGYPHYDQDEDIMSPGTPMERVRFDVENLTPSGQADGRRKDGPVEGPGDEDRDDPREPQREGAPEPAHNKQDDFDIGDEDYEELNQQEPRSPEDVPIQDADTDAFTEADVSDEERSLLAQSAVNADESDDVTAPLRARPDETDGDGDFLNEASGREDRPGADIDVPGSEADDRNEAIGEEDEENNYYSLDDQG